MNESRIGTAQEAMAQDSRSTLSGKNGLSPKCWWDFTVQYGILWDESEMKLGFLEL